MRRMTIAGLAALLAGGCSEYSLGEGYGPDRMTTIGGTATATDVPTTTAQPADPADPAERVPDTPRDGAEHVDAAVQAGSFLLDVLWVVDNSSSMGNDQDRLATHFPTFIDYFQGVEGVDYHVGVISTDVEDPSHQGKLREAGGVRWLEPGTPDKYGLFDDMAQMGTDGSGDESGRAAVHHATRTHIDGWNAGFFREEAALAIIVISDEEDSSSEFGIDVDPFVADLRAFKADPAMVSFSTIVGPVPDGCETAYPGFGYDEVQAAIGGVFHSICEPDWDKVLEDLAAHALSSKREFFLTDPPDPSTLEAQVIESDGTERWFLVNVDFTYDPVRNSITFGSYLPGPLAEVYVHYVPDFGSAW